MRNFKGRTLLVDLREHYLKDEQPAPGKKGTQHIHCLYMHTLVSHTYHTLCMSSFPQAGIALTEEQWGVVRANAARISAALAAHDATFELPLGSERRVQVPVMIGLRMQCADMCQHSIGWDACIYISSACRSASSRGAGA